MDADISYESCSQVDSLPLIIYLFALKIMERCSLPLTGKGVVDRIITDLCVFDVKSDGSGLELIEIAPGITLEELAEKTACDFTVVEGGAAPMRSV